MGSIFSCTGNGDTTTPPVQPELHPEISSSQQIVCPPPLHLRSISQHCDLEPPRIQHFRENSDSLNRYQAYAPTVVTFHHSRVNSLKNVPVSAT
jgi:hypothetical protein